MVTRVSTSVITVGVYQVARYLLAECLPLVLLLVYIRKQGVASRVLTSVITVGVYQVAMCG